MTIENNIPEKDINFKAPSDEPEDNTDYYSIPKVPRAERRGYKEDVAEFQGMIEAFEAQYPLEQLHAIVELTIPEALAHPLRRPAQQALGPILTKLFAIQRETTIPSKQYLELHAAYERLSKAVGNLSGDGNKIRH